MNKKLLTGLCPLLAAVGVAHAQGTAFTYQGRLNSVTNPATGLYDFSFNLFAASGGGSALTASNGVFAVPVNNGLFTVTLNFGNQFPGADRWLEITVRTNGNGAFATLAPRQPLTPAPYAIRAASAGTATTATTATTASSVAAGAVNGTALASNAIDSSKIADGSIATSDLSPAVLSNTFWRLTGNAGTTPGANFIGATDSNQVRLHATGGFLVDNTTPALNFGNQTRQMLNLWNTNYGLGVQSGTLYQRSDQHFAWYRLGNHADGTTDPGAGGLKQMALSSGGDLYVRQSVVVDDAGLNNGSSAPGLVFGSGSGETIASKRTAGGNQYGLDFYTGFQNRLAIDNNGRVGIGTNSPKSALHVVGTVTADNFLTTASDTQPPTGVTPILAMIWIKPGTFIMGSPSTETDRDPDEGPQTVVTITKGFWLGHHEVTQGEYLAVVGSNPGTPTGDLNLPVNWVTRSDASNYCRLLTQRELLAGRLPSGWSYRLPREAEWDYACRAWTTTRFSYGDDPSYASLTNYAWYSVNGAGVVHPVGQKLANPWGLVDMHGNVWEWCLDWYGSYPGGTVTDPQGPGSGTNWVLRGGSWLETGAGARWRSANRGQGNSGFRDDFGFRVALASQP